MHRWMQWWIFTWIRFVCQSVSKLEYSFPADYVDRLWTKKPNCSCHVSSIVFKAVKDTVWNSGRDHFPGSVMTFIPPVWIHIHHHVPKNIQVPFWQFNDTSPFPVFSVIFKSRTRVSRSESTSISGILNKTFWISSDEDTTDNLGDNDNHDLSGSDKKAKRELKKFSSREDASVCSRANYDATAAKYLRPKIAPRPFSRMWSMTFKVGFFQSEFRISKQIERTKENILWTNRSPRF